MKQARYLAVLVAGLSLSHSAFGQLNYAASATSPTGEPDTASTPEGENVAKDDVQEKEGEIVGSFLNNDAKGPLHTAGLWTFKCLQDNFNVIEIGVFRPKARIYFDTGDDDPGELDIFQDGALAPTINMIELNLNNTFREDRIGKDPDTGEDFVKPGSLLWGFNFGGGINAPAGSSSDGTTSSSAPVLLLSGGLQLQYRLDTETPAEVGAEVGYAWGITADESFGDVDDGAIYVGFTIGIVF